MGTFGVALGVGFSLVPTFGFFVIRFCQARNSGRNGRTQFISPSSLGVRIVHMGAAVAALVFFRGVYQSEFNPNICSLFHNQTACESFQCDEPPANGKATKLPYTCSWAEVQPFRQPAHNYSLRDAVDLDAKCVQAKCTLYENARSIVAEYVALITP